MFKLRKVPTGSIKSQHTYLGYRIAILHLAYPKGENETQSIDFKDDTRHFENKY